MELVTDEHGKVTLSILLRNTGQEFQVEIYLISRYLMHEFHFSQAIKAKIPYKQTSNPGYCFSNFGIVTFIIL